MLNNMSFREKSTWISFVLLLAISIPFFYQFVRIESGSTSSQASFHLFRARHRVHRREIVLHAIIVAQSP